MKNTHPHSISGVRKTACTVSAAALMLGVSHAATIGFNFQCNYNGYNGSYSGAYVTAPAFGIGTNGWESLTQMGTGYSTADNSPIMEVIDTTTAAGGLNPLPNGSLTVNWSAYTANVSGFGGYDSKPPNYSYAGTGHNTGEQEVYWGFLRDGVNFGPGSSGGNNNQPGYSIDITGLSSVFTNTPFVIELIASADSMQDLTNAFIITPANSTTQSVIYASTPPVANVGDTAWVRGIGGGISTVSGPINKDEVMIVGNRAAHAANPGGYNHASTIAGFVITDKPIITMSPQSVLVGAGDTVTLRAIAAGVPPLSYQWRNAGMPIANATNASFSISNLTAMANLDLVVTNLYGSATSLVATVSVDQLVMKPQLYVLDSKPSGTPIDGPDFGATWLASDTDSNGTNRLGVMLFTNTDPDQITLPGVTNFDSATGTIMFWVRASGTSGNGAALVDRSTTNGLVIAQHLDGSIFIQAANSANTFGSFNVLSDNNWHQIAVVFDQSASGSIAIYFDGVPDNSNPNASAWSWPVGQEIELGHSHNSNWQSYSGLMDDFRVYNRVLTDTEIAAAYNGSLVDTSALQVRLNFDTPPKLVGAGVSWQINGAVLQSANVVNGPYTDITPAVSSPYYFEVKSTAQFYRYRRTATNVLTNPYDM